MRVLLRVEDSLPLASVLASVRYLNLRNTQPALDELALLDEANASVLQLAHSNLRVAVHQRQTHSLQLEPDLQLPVARRPSFPRRLVRLVRLVRRLQQLQPASFASRRPFPRLLDASRDAQRATTGAAEKTPPSPLFGKLVRRHLSEQ